MILSIPGLKHKLKPKMKKTGILLSIAAAIFAASCVHDNLADETSEGRLASDLLWEAEYVCDGPEADDTQAKTTISGNRTKVYWEYGDGIGFYTFENICNGSVISKDSYQQRAVIQLEASMPVRPYAAVHNSDNVSLVNGLLWKDENEVLVYMKENQTGRFSDANISAAKVMSGSQTLRFYNLLPVFEMEVTNPSVRKISIEAENTIITGSVRAIFNTDGTLAKVERHALDGMAISIDIDGPGTYYASLLPTTLSKGVLSIRYKDASGNVVNSITSPKLLMIQPGQLYRWGDIADHDVSSKTLPKGNVFNNYMKQLAGSLANIKTIQFVRNNTATAGTRISENVYMAYSNGLITVTTSKPEFYANPDCSDMFANLSNLTNIYGLYYVNTSAVTDMNAMFYQCGQLVDFDLTGFDTSNVDSMFDMFYSCSSLEELDLTSFNTRNVNNMGYMFEWCYALRKVFAGKNFVLKNGLFAEEMLLGDAFTVYGSTETMKSFLDNLVPGDNQDYSPHAIHFAIDMGEAGFWSAMNMGAYRLIDNGYYFTWHGKDSKGYWKDGISDGHAFVKSEYTYGDSYGRDWDKIPGNYPSWPTSEWRMPKEADINALLANTTAEVTGYGAAWGVTFTHKTNGNSIHIPYTGPIYSSSKHSGCAIWVGDYHGDTDFGTYFDLVDKGIHDDYPSYYGLPIRPISKFGSKAVTSISVSPSSLVMHKGESRVLSATVNPSDAFDKTLTWSSDNTSVVTVSGSKVTAVGLGSANVTVRNSASGVYARVSVTVESVNPSSVRIVNAFNGSEEWSGSVTLIEDVEGESYHGVRAVVSPSNADYHIRWETSGAHVSETMGSELGFFTPYIREGSNPFLFCASTNGQTASDYLRCVVTSSDGTVVLKKTVNLSIAVSEKQCIKVNLSSATGFKPSGNRSFNSQGQTSCHGVFPAANPTDGYNYYLHFDKKVNLIPAEAFYGTGLLKAVKLPSDVKSIEIAAFQACSSLEKVEFNEGLETIGERAFSSSKKLNNLEFPSTLRTIGFNAFSYCSSLSRVVFNEGLKTIDDNAFLSDSNSNIGLKEFTLPSTLESIGAKAFRDMRKETVFIPASVKYMGEGAFDDCGSLKTVFMYCTTPPQSSGNGPFGAGNLTKLQYFYVYPSALSAFSTSPYYKQFKSVMKTF